MKKKLLMAALLMGCLTDAAFAQMTLQGKVVDENGQPLPGANVRLEQTTIGCATNNKGEFRITDIADGTYTLRASYLNYEAYSQVIGSTEENLTIRMKPAYVNLNQVVVTGTGTHRRLKDSPVPVEVITANDIKKSGTVTFEETMTMLNPSVNFRQNSMGSNFTMNGLTNKHILILIDGKKMAGDISGNTDLSRIDMSRVKRIEVVKGAASSLYGSDAIAGVINIITDQSKDRLNVSSNTRIGGYGSLTEQVNLDFNVGKVTSSTSYQHLQSNGWQLSPYETIGNEVVETVKEATSGYHSNIVNQQLSYAPTKALRLYAEGNYFDKTLDRKDKGWDYDMFYKDYNFSVGGKYLLGNAAYIDLDLYADNYEYWKQYTVDGKTYEAGDEEMTKRQKYYSANLKSVFKAGSFNKITVGTEYVLDYMKNPESLDGSKQVYTYALYAQDEIRLFDNLQLIPGFRYIYHETAKSRFTPKLAAMYSWKNFNFRASYAAGFKAPTLQELYYDYESRGSVSQGNPDLKPENSNYYSLNAEYNHTRFSVSVTGYINNIENIIVRSPKELTAADKENGIKNRYLYENIEKARVKGVDINLNTYLGAGFTAGAAYTYADPEDLQTNEQITETVKHAGSVRAGWNKTWNTYTLGVNLTGRIQGVKYFGGGDEDAVKYTLWNLTTTHSLAYIGPWKFEGILGIDNIFHFTDDRPYGVRYATLNPGRTVFASLLVRFKL